MEEVLLSALIACVEKGYSCNKQDYETYTRVTVCDVAPNHEGTQPARIAAQVNGKNYFVILEAKCKNV